MPKFIDYMKKFAEASRRYTREIRKLKNEGKKVVCWYGSYVPIEIIHASGAVQYPLFDGGEPAPAEAALEFFPFCVNVQARYQVGQHLMGLNAITPIADCIVIDSKDADAVRIGSAFEYLNLPVRFLGVPQDWEKEIAFNYYKRQLNKLKDELEKLTGERITSEKLFESIKKYNRIREILSEIGSLRKEHPPLIGGEEFVKLNHYALRCDPDTAVNTLEKVSEHLKEEKSSFSENTSRIMVAGRGFAFGDYTLLKIIEESGGVVVTELLDEGIMHLEKVKVDGNPIENISERYYRAKVPSCFFSPSFRRRWESIIRLINEYQADGLLCYTLAFDVIYDHEWPILSKRACEKGIPFSMVESAYSFSRESTETLRIRIENFIEICKRR